MATATQTETIVPRLKQRYEDEIRAALQEELVLDSVMQVPRVSKITLNMGVGEAKTDAKALDAAIEELTTIAGQRAQVRKARKSIASFKLREGMSVGARVTLRGARMYEFLDRLVSIALPRIRDPRAQPGLLRRPWQLLLDRHQGSESSSPRSTTTRAGDPGPRHRDHHDGGDRRAGRASRARSACHSPRREGTVVAKTSLRVKQKRQQKFGVRAPYRYNRCGRPRAVFHGYKLCRICLRDLAHEGAIPDMTKAPGDHVITRNFFRIFWSIPQAEIDGAWKDKRDADRSDRRRAEPHPQRESRDATPSRCPPPA
jgi:ribosomal protein S14